MSASAKSPKPAAKGKAARGKQAAPNRSKAKAPGPKQSTLPSRKAARARRESEDEPTLEQQLLFTKLSSVTATKPSVPSKAAKSQRATKRAQGTKAKTVETISSASRQKSATATTAAKNLPSRTITRAVPRRKIRAVAAKEPKNEGGKLTQASSKAAVLKRPITENATKFSQPKRAPKEAVVESLAAAAHHQKMSERQPLPAVAEELPVTPSTPPLPFPVPSILLEGDEPYVPPPGPGHKFALRHPRRGGEPPPASKIPTLPESYGSGRITATARDPRTLYVHWDFTFEQQKRFNEISATGAMTLRMRCHSVDGPIVAIFDLHPDSRHWFAHVSDPDTPYVAELGYTQRDGGWVRAGISEAVRTPPENPAAASAEAIRFARVPELAPPVRRPAKPAAFGFGAVTGEDPGHSPALGAPPFAAEKSWQSAGEAQTQLQPPRLEFVPPPFVWTETQERILAEMISEVVTRSDWFGSVEIVELLRKQVERELIQGIPGMEAELPSSGELAGGGQMAPELLPSSPAGGEGRPGERSFWFNVNAELIIYGATEPGATVTIGGRRIRLRPDGTFSYRFALPDGQYRLPAEAISNDGDIRKADLQFSRATQYSGEVGKHPQDPALKIPAPENTF